MIGSTQLYYAAAIDQECIDIIIIDDSALESNESFTIHLTSNSDRVTILTEAVMATITNNDRECVLSDLLSYFDHENTCSYDRIVFYGTYHLQTCCILCKNLLLYAF